MFFLRRSLWSLASAALYASVQASYLNNDLSFGHNNKISSNLRTIPNFDISGTPDPPQVLSNKVILTPPAPGSQRGAIWSEKTLAYSSWAVDFDFRTTGPERGSGNIQLWYADRGKEQVGTSSIYTVGKFDGLAVVIDQYAASGGYIRGFLNDGNTDFKSHHSVDSLAFGHCQYSYRNLGRPSRIAVRQSADNFVVEVDGRVCFESPKIRLPTGYQFGVTAASADNPDSFEVFKLVVTTEFSSPEAEDPTYQAATPRTDTSNLFNKAEPISIQDIPDEPASAVKADAQFADLHNRLQIMMKHISALNRDVVTANGEAKARMDELDEKIRRLEKATDRLNSMDRKLGEIQGDVRQTKKDLQSTLDKGVAGLKTVVADTHRTMLGSLAASAPSLMGYILVAVGSQALTVAAYLLYKRRKAASPKKYL